MLIQFLQATVFFVSILLVESSNLSVGSVFFGEHHTRQYWSDTDLAMLRARRIMQQIIPPATTPNDVDKVYVKDVLSYFSTALKKVKLTTDKETRKILKQALADTVGGYLRAELLPNVKYAYYAGSLNYDDVHDIIALYEEVKEYLNTQGVGWSPPKRIKKSYTFNVVRIETNPRLYDACSMVISVRDSGECMIIPMPMLDEIEEPSSIAFPMTENTLMGLFSRRSSRSLVQFYRMAAECVLQESSLQCRQKSFSRFNRDVCYWLQREIAPRLEDERWYAGFGGVLRVAATVQEFCNAQDGYLSASHPKVARLVNRHTNDLFQKCNKFILIQLVIAIALSVWMFLSIMTWVNRKRQERLLKVPPKIFMRKPPGKSYTVIETAASKRGMDIETMSDQTRISRSLPLKTESVYDLNEQVMKQMPVPECVEAEIRQVEYHQDLVPNSVSTSSCSTTHSNARLELSPPRIQSSVFQLQVKKARCEEPVRPPVYSTSEVTNVRFVKALSSYRSGRSTQTFVKASESNSSSVWSSSTGSSLGSQDLRRSGAKRAVAKIAKDLAWAKRLATRRKRDPTEEAKGKTVQNK